MIKSALVDAATVPVHRGTAPRSSRWSPHGGVPGRSHPQDLHWPFRGRRRSSPATPIPAASADADNARLKVISSLRFSSMWAVTCHMRVTLGLQTLSGSVVAMCAGCASDNRSTTIAINGIEEALATPVDAGRRLMCDHMRSSASFPTNVEVARRPAARAHRGYAFFVRHLPVVAIDPDQSPGRRRPSRPRPAPSDRGGRPER